MYNMYGKYCLLFVLNMALLFKVNFFLIGYCKGLAVLIRFKTVYLIPNSIATKHNCKYTSPQHLYFFHLNQVRLFTISTRISLQKEKSCWDILICKLRHSVIRLNPTLDFKIRS